jgi:hypothetical protein
MRPRSRDRFTIVATRKDEAPIVGLSSLVGIHRLIDHQIAAVALDNSFKALDCLGSSTAPSVSHQSDGPRASPSGAICSRRADVQPRRTLSAFVSGRSSSLGIKSSPEKM